MTTSILPLALAYVFLLFLLLLLLLRSEIGAGLKLTLVVLTGGFYLWHYVSLQGQLGWPVDERLPASFEVIQRVVVEPDLAGDEDGSIYLWLLDLERGDRVPRAYRLPYDKAVHRKVEDTVRRQQQGERFVGKPSPGSGRGIEFESVERERQGLKPAPGNGG